MRSRLKQLSNFSYTWELTHENKSLVFDTTATNSGMHKGAAKLLEVILGVWEKVKSPDTPWFQKFWVIWPDIDKYSYPHN